MLRLPRTQWPLYLIAAIVTAAVVVPAAMPSAVGLVPTGSGNPFGGRSGLPSLASSGKMSLTITSATSGFVGSTVTLSGSGFAPSSSVTFSISAGTIVGQPPCFTGATGSFSGCTFVVPPTQNGLHNVYAIDAKGNSASTKFTVLASLAIVGLPGGKVGSTVTLNGAGYSTTSAITFAISGGKITSQSTCKTSTLGSFSSCTFVVPTGLALGAHSVTATDAHGVVNANAVTFTVETPLVAGAVTPAGPSIDVGQSVTLRSNASGGETPYSYRWLASSSPGTSCSGSLSATTANVSVSPGANLSYCYTVQDAVGFVASSAWDAVTVYPDPVAGAPTANRAALDVNFGQNVTFTAHPSGGTGVYTGYAWNGLPGGCSGTTGPSPVCAPTAFDLGTFNVSYRVNDSNGATSSPSPTVELVVAQPAEFVVFSPTALEVGVTGSPFSVEYLFGGIPPFEYNWTVPASCGSPGNVTQVTCTPGPNDTPGLQVTVYPVSIAVTDASGAVFALPSPSEAYPHVTASLSTTAWFESPNYLLEENGIPGHFAASAQLGLPGYTYAWSGLPAGCGAPGNVASFDCTAAPGDAAHSPYTVTVQVTDGLGGVAYAHLNLTVYPVLAKGGSFLAPALDVGEAVVFSTNSTVTGGWPATIEYAWVNGGAPYLTCASVSDLSYFVCRANASTTTPGLAYTNVQVYDALGGFIDQVFFVNTIDPELLVNLTVSASSFSVNSTEHYVANATGGSGSYAYVWSGLPTGCAAGNVSSFNCTPTASGNYTVTVSVTDTNGVTVTVAVTVSVSSTSGSSGGTTSGGGGSGCSPFLGSGTFSSGSGTGQVVNC